MRYALKQHAEPAAEISRWDLWARVRAVSRHIATERSSPARVGWAVAIGIIVGTSPFIGLHLVICIVIATLLGLNRALTYLAANISLPWLAPFLIFASVQLGSRVLSGHWLSLSVDAIRGIDPVTFGAQWFLGAALLGVLLGVPAGLGAYTAARIYHRRHPLPPDPHGDLMAGVAARYKPAGRFAHGYVRGKLTHDPVYRQLLEHGPFVGPVLDVGCGRGQTGMLLKAAQPQLSIVGFDWEGAKIALAERVAAREVGLAFRVADIRNSPLPVSGTVLLIDVLHYNPPDVQDAMLARAAAAIQPGGRLFVRDVDAAAGWRARINIWQERVGCLVGLNRGATLHFRPASDIVAQLERGGLTVSTCASYGDTPLANVLIVGTRP